MNSNMSQRYRLFRRGWGVYYFEDTHTGKQQSLGTAHKLEGGLYAQKYVASFVGFAPVSDPRLVVAVMIDEPSAGKYYGGEVAAPVFAPVMAGALRALGVQPDAPLKPLQMANLPEVREGL